MARVLTLRYISTLNRGQNEKYRIDLSASQTSHRLLRHLHFHAARQVMQYVSCLTPTEAGWRKTKLLSVLDPKGGATLANKTHQGLWPTSEDMWDSQCGMWDTGYPQRPISPNKAALCIASWEELLSPAISHTVLRSTLSGREQNCQGTC